MTGKVIVRLATAEDIAAFSDMSDKPTILAWCGELDGTIIGLGGFAFSHGRWVAFCDLSEAARPYKMHLMRTAKRAIAEARRCGIKFLYAAADETEPGAIAWIKSLGAEPDPRSNKLYRWRLK